ncbi:MATE family efflux transporter [Gracilinema caldarium]|uniref:MATE family efflux transporter n=1 Tax=Gracilinema caldarium TaxID=215591 RepID=UPI0026F21753|nr:MATE family efflux transporter [Gracilinema caldarium]
MHRQNKHKNSIRREFILHGNLWTIIFNIGLPLVFYNSISQLFGIIDTLIAASLGARIVSTVSFISQIQSLFAAVSAGLGVGGGVLIAKKIGSQDYQHMQRYIATFLFLITGFIILILVTALPLAPWILQLFKIPQDLLHPGIELFRLELIGLVFIFINTFYFTIERSWGNSETIFWVNTLILIIKLVATLIFLHYFHLGAISLSLASLVAQAIVSIIAVLSFMRNEGKKIIGIIKTEGLNYVAAHEILTLSLPVFLEKFIFNYGKAVVNTMSAAYGSMAIGALGVSNRIGGIATMPPIGFQEAEATIISQNLGNQNTKRAIEAYKITFIINFIFGLIIFFAMSIGKDWLVNLFAKGDVTFANEISRVYQYERYASILLAISSSVMGLLYGFGYTRTAMILNLLRLFAFRIPPLWYFQHFTNLKTEGLGLAMMISNMMMGVSALIVVQIIIYKYRKTVQYDSL